MKLPVDDLTAEAFAGFGQVIDLPSRTADGGGPGWSYWGGLAAMPPSGAGYSIGYLNLAPTPLRFDWAERHALTAELLVPTQGECMIHVAPADYPDDLGHLPPLERFRLFRVRHGQAVVFDPKVWHGAPLAAGGTLQVVVVLQTGTGPDNSSVVRFFEGAAIEPSD